MKRVPLVFGAAAILVLWLVPRAEAQAGPPFRTDDPETPGNRQSEINLGLIGDRNRTQGSYATPNFDINYGLGDRIQLKYELPFNLQQTRGDSGHVLGGLGNSLLGLKWRFYEHLEAASQGDKSNFGLSIYPQLTVNNPTNSVRRGIVDHGPKLLLPMEANARLGPVRIVVEGGYSFAAKSTPDSWIAGFMAGHEFGATELYAEFHDQGDIHGPSRETTLGIGGRHPIDRQKRLLFMGMVGRSLRTASPSNEQPQWIAYLGLQWRMATGTK